MTFPSGSRERLGGSPSFGEFFEAGIGGRLLELSTSSDDGKPIEGSTSPAAVIGERGDAECGA
jgi:hypothetical protein